MVGPINGPGSGIGNNGNGIENKNTVTENGTTYNIVPEGTQGAVQLSDGSWGVQVNQNSDQNFGVEENNTPKSDPKDPKTQKEINEWTDLLNKEKENAYLKGQVDAFTKIAGNKTAGGTEQKQAQKTDSWLAAIQSALASIGKTGSSRRNSSNCNAFSMMGSLISAYAQNEINNQAIDSANKNNNNNKTNNDTNNNGTKTDTTKSENKDDKDKDKK